MLIPLGPARYEVEIKRSRFIAEISGCVTRDEAESILSRRREAHPGAAHVVYAFSLGDERSRQFGMSDDGEPKGTAGRPVLEVLRG
ncbi:MAG: YigZ family protein, partial [Alkalispirochaeta sp.]